MKENKKRALKALKKDYEKALAENKAYRELHGEMPEQIIEAFNPIEDLMKTALTNIRNSKLSLISFLHEMEQTFLLDRAGDMDEIEKEDHIHYIRCLKTVVYNA